jgi:tRNA threonylcarbamoyladenosine biosynthesis protein TsaE
MTISSSSESETREKTPDPNLGESVTRSAQETFALARSIGEQLKGGEVFLLKGDLGAGKTIFAKGLAAGLGIEPADVTSPTFTLINVHQGRLPFYHVDLYRLDAGSLTNLGLEEIFDDEKAVTVIEWADRLGYTPVNSRSVTFEYLGDNERRILC